MKCIITIQISLIPVYKGKGVNNSSSWCCYSKHLTQHADNWGIIVCNQLWLYSGDRAPIYRPNFHFVPGFFGNFFLFEGSGVSGFAVLGSMFFISLIFLCWLLKLWGICYSVQYYLKSFIFGNCRSLHLQWEKLYNLFISENQWAYFVFSLFLTGNGCREYQIW